MFVDKIHSEYMRYYFCRRICPQVAALGSSFVNQCLAACTSKKKLKKFLRFIWWNEIKVIVLHKQINNAYATQTI